MNVEIETLAPSESVVPRLVSSSKHIVRKRLAEFQPQAQVSYTYSGNNEIIFDINSASDFADFANGYMKFKLTCSMNLNGSALSNIYLSEGGAHALFRNITIESLSGSQIQRIERYNKMYSILSSATHSPDYVENSLWRAGDSMDVGDIPNNISDSVGFPLTGTFAYTTATRTITGTNSLFTTELAVGDYVELISAALTTTAKVKTITSATSIVLENIIEGGANFTPASIIAYKTKSANRKLYANSADIVCTMQPLVSFLQMSEWVPLFLLRGGLRIRLELERPELCLCSPSQTTGTGFTGASYTISNPTYLIPLIQPDDELRNQYVSMYKTSGINYSFLDYRHYLDIVASGQSGLHSTQINANVRSAKFILGRIQNLRAETITAATADAGQSTFTCDSIAQGLKAGLSEVQFVSGSERFPQSKPLDTSNLSNSELYIEMERVFGNLGVVVSGTRFSPLDWQERVNDSRIYEATLKADSQRLIIASELSRDLHSTMAGLNLSLSPLQCELNFGSVYQITDLNGDSNNANANKYIHWFLGFDSILSISEAGGVVKYN